MAAPGSTEKTDRTFRFGPFELSERDAELRKNGIRLKIQEQPFRVLLELVSNSGKVVSREELQQRLWSEDTFVDFDTGLNTAIRKLRQALNDNADEPRYIETLARRGYRFIAPVAVTTPAISGTVGTVNPQSQVSIPAPAFEKPMVAAAAEVKSDSSSVAAPVLLEEPSPALIRAATYQHNTKWKWFTVGALVAALIITAVFWSTRPPREPVVEVINQLTDDQMGKIYVQTDGARVYFNEDRQGSLELAQVSVKGGPVSTIPTEVLSPEMTSISPDASSLLVLQGGIPVSRPLWEVPLPAGPARRISNLESHEASFTPDGRLLICNIADLLIAEKDGSNPHTILTLKEGHFGGAEMSPDGRRIVFTLYGAPELYVVNSDGTGMRPLAKNPGPGGFCCVRWTLDGKYIVFSTRFPQPRQDLWYMRMSDGWLQFSSQPRRLTAGPLSYWMPALSRDGKTIFAIGTKLRNELFRYNLASRTTVPFVPGVLGPTYSRDGQWMAYSSADGSVWRSRSDGSERLQLTFPPPATWGVVLSPDGKSVCYDNVDGVFIIGRDGGAPKKVIDHPVGSLSWSPDTNFLVFTDGKVSWQTPDIKLLDLRNGQVSPIPGGQLGPQWVAPGKIVAARRDLLVLQIYDVATQQWSDLTKPEDGPIVNWAHAPDFSFFYYTTSGQNARLMRVRSSDLNSEVIANRKDIRLPVGSGTTAAMGVTPDGSPLFIYEVGTQEIYALSVHWP